MYKLSSLGSRRSRRVASPKAPLFSPVTPPFSHGGNTLDRAEPSTHNHAEKNHGPLYNPRKRARKAFNDEQPTPPRREFSVLRDEILGNPSKKRRVSSHLVRESVSQKYNANIGSTRRRSDSSIPKSSNGTPNRRSSLRRTGSIAKSMVGLIETPTQAARLDATNASTSVSSYAGGVNTPKSQNSLEPLRRSTRLSALQQELHDQLPSKPKEEQHPEATDRIEATSPEGARDCSAGISALVSTNKAQHPTTNLSQELLHTQTGRFSKSAITKKMKGLASSQLPQRRSDRIGKRRL